MRLVELTNLITSLFPSPGFFPTSSPCYLFFPRGICFSFHVAWLVFFSPIQSKTHWDTAQPRRLLIGVPSNCSRDQKREMEASSLFCSVFSMSGGENRSCPYLPTADRFKWCGTYFYRLIHVGKEKKKSCLPLPIGLFLLFILFEMRSIGGCNLLVARIFRRFMS